MIIRRRIERAERELGLGQKTRPWVLVLRAGPVTDEAAYEARLRRRVEDVCRWYPKDQFRLLL